MPSASYMQNVANTSRAISSRERLLYLQNVLQKAVCVLIATYKMRSIDAKSKHLVLGKSAYRQRVFL